MTHPSLCSAKQHEELTLWRLVKIRVALRVTGSQLGFVSGPPRPHDQIFVKLFKIDQWNLSQKGGGGQGARGGQWLGRKDQEQRHLQHYSTQCPVPTSYRTQCIFVGKTGSWMLHRRFFRTSEKTYCASVRKTSSWLPYKTKKCFYCKHLATHKYSVQEKCNFLGSTSIYIQDIHKRMVRFQKLTKQFISHLTRAQRTPSAAATVQFSCATSSSFLMLTARPRAQFPRWRRSRKRRSVCSVLRCPDLWLQCSVYGLEKTHHAWCISCIYK